MRPQLFHKQVPWKAIHVLDQEPDVPVPTDPSHQPHLSSMALLQAALPLFTMGLIVLALCAGAGVVLSDLAAPWVAGLPHAPLSAAPLLLIGAASLSFQALTHPKPLELFKALLVSLAFLLWGIDQLLPPGWLTTTVGDVVIVLYVLDLGWIMGSALRTRKPGKER